MADNYLVHTGLNSTTVYVAMDFMIPSANYASMVANGGDTKHTIVGLTHMGQSPLVFIGVSAQFQRVGSYLDLVYISPAVAKHYTVDPDIWYTYQFVVQPDPGIGE
jgi:hypothetical protein